MSKFTTLVEDPEWGNYYALTKGGYIALIILMILVIGVAVYFAQKKQKTGKFTSKKLAVAGISLALAFITSFIKVELPMGGSVTLFSMFFICFVGYLYGVNIGLITAFAYSILEFIQTGASYFLSPFQICCDYFFAFTALGIAGFWYQKKNGLIKGFIIACLVRGLFHTIGGYIYWMDYMPDWFPKSISWLYSIAYNYSYILTEMVLTLILLSITPVRKAIERIASQMGENAALESGNEDEKQGEDA